MDADELLVSLPEYLAERTRALNATPSNPDGEFVLYWMRTAVRVDENPALDVCTEWANQCGLQVLVYHALPETYPYASDRHHTFLMEGARDLAHSIANRNVAYAFHLQRRAHRGRHLVDLANRAAIVVTEDMPVQPLWNWTQRLASESKCTVFAVDTACIVPMQLVGKSYDRAFRFRDATKKMREQRLDRLHPPLLASTPATLPDNLPFAPIDWSNSRIADLVAECDIDHTIGPVPHTRGGSTAGYKRWDAFRDQRLVDYARRRNDALVDGVSRMSAYLHYGMVAPMRLAREAAQLDHAGAEKYLDELLIWRELAYVFCRFHAEHDSLEAIPAWARATLAEHESDSREAIFDWESLARARTGDSLWDAAQQSLLMQGELHNNVRMTWGKSLLKWTTTAAQALDFLMDLNHRYALDGRDPASYGGILWCLGQFDRPFTPAEPIFGTVRSRMTKDHAKRMDVNAYRAMTTRPLVVPTPRIAVIGAGISGLICARTLSDHGLDVRVFEKSRGVGGRMATRRGEQGLRFDHGAQYFTARDARFARYVDAWQAQGLVRRWDAQIVTLAGGHVLDERQDDKARYVAAPGMNGLCKHLADSLPVTFHSQADRLTRQDDDWQLDDASGQSLGRFDIVLSSAPPPQTAHLLSPSSQIASTAAACKMNGCWAMMVAFPNRFDVEWDGAFVQDSPISWIARDSSKPECASDRETWVVHASHEWSQPRMDESPASIEPVLLQSFFEATGGAFMAPAYATTHRWRFAIPVSPLDDRDCLWDEENRLGACGDWCHGRRVESAFLSGAGMAGRVLSAIHCRS